MPAAMIKLFLPTGETIAGPRTEFDTLLKCPEQGSPEIYLLLGSDEAGDLLIYIGESECV